MEWVEVTAKTVEEAKEMALDQLGVDESDAEFEVLEEPKAGLFGLLRTQARVRARVVPTAARPKTERRERKRSGGGSGGAGGGGRPAAAGCGVVVGAPRLGVGRVRAGGRDGSGNGAKGRERRPAGLGRRGSGLGSPLGWAPAQSGQGRSTVATGGSGVTGRNWHARG